MKYVSSCLFKVLKGKHTLKLCCKVKHARFISLATRNGFVNGHVARKDLYMYIGTWPENLFRYIITLLTDYCLAPS